MHHDTVAMPDTAVRPLKPIDVAIAVRHLGRVAMPDTAVRPLKPADRRGQPQDPCHQVAMPDTAVRPLKHSFSASFSPSFHSGSNARHGREATETATSLGHTGRQTSSNARHGREATETRLRAICSDNASA